MAFQSVPNTAEAVINYTCAGKAIVNVLNFTRVAGYEQDDIDALAALVDDSVGNHFLPLMHQDCSYINTHVRGLESILDLEAVNGDSAGVGALTGQKMPNEVSFAISLRTGLTGRSARGRMFVPTVAASQLLDSNHITTAVADDWVDALEAVNVAALVSEWQLVVVSRFTLGAPRAVGVVNPVVTILYTDTLLDSQRNRKPD